MSVIEYEIKDPKKQRDFYRDLCEVKDIKINQLQQEHKQLVQDIKHLLNVIKKNDIEFTREECEVYEKWLDKVKELEEGINEKVF